MIRNQKGTSALQVGIVKANNQAHLTKWSDMDILAKAVVGSVINLNRLEGGARNKRNGMCQGFWDTKIDKLVSNSSLTRLWISG